ncbi:MAG TPA: SDR family NAD(P)-dependent oxidoreductase [Chloroflexota bacterium]|nr:SDR family NAD(P)-dependent oxidoreductase [Chloroflexota bacterium]
MSFEGKVAIVTGGGSGIGRGVGLRLARDGASVVVADVNDAAAQKVAEEVDGLGIQTDVASEQQVAGMVDQAISRFGRLDFLVNCAGNAAFAPVAELSLADWQAVIDVHLTGAFLCCRAALDHLVAAKGRIVSVSSNYGFKGRPGGSNYSAAKAGIVGLTKVLAYELAPDVTVNAIAPGPTDTPRWRRSMEDGGAGFEAKRAQRVKDIPLGRLGEPDDIAGGVAFLLGADARWITGSVLHVNGGEFML